MTIQQPTPPPTCHGGWRVALGEPHVLGLGLSLRTFVAALGQGGGEGQMKNKPHAGGVLLSGGAGDS